VHLPLGADINPPGRVVEQQDLRLQLQPLGEHDLLLVAAGQRPGRAVDRPGPDVEPPRLLLRPAAQRPAPDQPPVTAQRDGPHLRDVLPQRLVEHETDPAAVTAHQRHAGGHRGAPGTRHRRAVRHQHLPGPRPRAPGHQVEQVVVAGADQAGQPDDLTRRD
jgi:hypothetical protein